MDIQSLLSIIKNLPFLTGYITGNKAFERPMSEEEEKYYVKKFIDGDESAKTILIERNLRLVAHIAKKYSQNFRDADDLISMGTVGLIKAIDSYKPDKGTKLGTYASKCIENEILMLIRSNKKWKNDAFLQDSVGVDREGNEILLIDVLKCDDDSILEIVEFKMQLKRICKGIEDVLNEREQFVIKSRYGLDNKEPLTQKQVGKIMNISRSYVSRIEKKAIKKLSVELNKENEY